MIGLLLIRRRVSLYSCNCTGRALPATVGRFFPGPQVPYLILSYFLGVCFRGRSEEERRGDAVAARAKELPDEFASQAERR